MKTFETFEKVEGSQPCMKKPIVVHAVQIHEPFRVESMEGNYKQGKAGDYLMTGIEGEHYICDKEIFEKTYNMNYSFWSFVIDEVKRALKKLFLLE